MGYGRQWFGHHDVPQPEMATVGVQVSWRGALPEVALWPADRAVMVSAKALGAKEALFGN